jgi:hypothetical protein
LKAVHHIIVSSAYFQALPTRVSSVQPAPPYLVILAIAALHDRGVAAKLNLKAKFESGSS